MRLKGSAAARRLAEAIAGSFGGAAGLSSLIGRAANVPVTYEFPEGHGFPQWEAALAVGLGAALIYHAWREHAREVGGPPKWAPIPVVVVAGALVMTFWAGLSQRENTAFQARTLEEAAALARGVASNVDREQNAFERLARDWAEGARDSPRLEQIDAGAQFDKSTASGCTAISRIDSSGQTLWTIPAAGNERLLGFNQNSVRERREALERATRHVEITGSTDIAGHARGGFVLFAPIVSDGHSQGWIAAEFLYRPLLRSVAEDDLKLADEYYVSAEVSGEPVYSGGGIDPAAGARYEITRSFSVLGRPLTVEVTPADPQRLRDLKSLPDFALTAGLILTGLLGLSTHFGRSARSGQRSAEESNRLLTQENEERRRVENRLKLSDERLRLALDSTEIGIFEWSVASGHVFFSAGLWAMFGYDGARMPSTAAAWENLIHADDVGTFRSRMEIQLAGNATFVDFEYRVRNAQGKWRWVYMRSKAVATDAQNRPTRLIGTVQDVTARVETEHQLRRAKAEADATSRAKSEFLASMSHEIRTPMNGIIGMTSLIMDTPLTDEQRDYIGTIRNSSEALLTIVNDILDFSKIESGKLELERLPFGLAPCLEETLDLFTAAATGKGIELAYRIDPQVPPWLKGDVTRLWQIISNLVNNAVKFTTAGSITIEVSLLSAPADGRLKLEFAVRDTGMGIPPDRMSRLFKAFSQVDSSTTRRFGGTGLGLAICDRLSQLMGGTIHAESAVGEGSAFIFTIVSESAPTPADQDVWPKLPAEIASGTILAIEDNRVTAQRLRDLFARWGAKIQVVATADEADDAVAKLGAAPVLLLVDHQTASGPTPEKGTAQLACPRLLMIPFGRTADPAPAGRAVESVTKPLKTGAVVQGTIRLFDRQASAQRPTGGGSDLLSREIPLRVLLAEDNAVNQKVALGLLLRLGYRAELASNGREAVERALQGGFDLILMDLQMPEMDGLQASREIRKKLPKDKQPKIIALTANAMQGDRELCLSAGMDDYVAKPVKLPEVAAAIRRQCADRNATGTPAPPPAEMGRKPEA
ncbi:MAG TPA: ATP-binding protein [Opitutaceae bacterium]|jgi:PAS domain S-box-containing protein